MLGSPRKRNTLAGGRNLLKKAHEGSPGSDERRASRVSPSSSLGRSRSPRDLHRTCHCIHTSTSSCQTEFSRGRWSRPVPGAAQAHRRGSRGCRGADRATSPPLDRATRAFGRAAGRARGHLCIGGSSSTPEPASIPYRFGPKGSLPSSRASLSRPAGMSTNTIAQPSSACANMAVARAELWAVCTKGEALEFTQCPHHG